MKFKRGFTNHVCIVNLLVKIDKRLLKLEKNLKFAKNMNTMEILQDKSNMRSTTPLAKSNMSLSILNDMGVIILDPNIMKSDDMAS